MSGRTVKSDGGDESNRYSIGELKQSVRMQSSYRHKFVLTQPSSGRDK